MNIIQNGESSKSPYTQGINGDLTKVDADVEMMDGENGVRVELGRPEMNNGDEGIENERKRGTARLIMPHWDVAPAKPIHSSQDLISLLHLDTLYNTYVRPFADLPGEEGQPGAGADGNDAFQRGKKKGTSMPGRKKMEKGYQHLIEDCIDPTPLGYKNDNPSLLPLLNDILYPPAPPPVLSQGPIEALPKEAFAIAKLEPGTVQDGYVGGQKVGVREAEEKRKRKRAARTTTAEIISPLNPAFPGHGQGRSSTPGTPLLPVPPPTRGFPPGANTPRRGTAPPGQGGGGGGSGFQGVHPFARHGQAAGAGSGPGGRPFTHSSKQRPASMEVQGSESGRKGLPSRSASPMPLSAGATPADRGGGGVKGGGTLASASASVSGSISGQRQFPSNRNKRPGSADVQSLQTKKSKGGSRSASPIPGAGVGQGQLRR
ncbi:hypothetical protein I307_03687 [Cryptococcus deuterogattii 99/473]|uniref:Unplaced genomic scaffold supercont1.1, whole genome shotgun sequence n=1 Tax=Cryptococcus deuterogattii Ram5 TaxID=1296110 RepID=A0A0D0U4W0_9TREE|nr:hypothetical protein I313_00074 [Cryptococcus deuterogattii Ram5]KIR74566.1 hypothetical protein I310_00839 [Cryptococcus deuterogattii CA1014]KIS01673.1 hypothetical protein L804_01552 [Cryptococcus deuterogattii 2001/935-1]KIY56949.1 hypothetical protein I307_03687 [Cryptococcus deuterogattii 99/473]